MHELNAHAVSAMLITLGALVLFTRENIRLEFSCILIMCVLVLGFTLFPYSDIDRTIAAGDLLAGFGNPALVTIVLLMMLARGVELTGALNPLADALARVWQINHTLALLLTMLAAAILSAFFNNTPLVVMLLPLLISVTRRAHVVPSKVLMPVGFATIIGGMSTTIGTSTNLLVVSLSADIGGPQFNMFDFALPAIAAGSVAILYLWLIAPRLLPAREPSLIESVPRLFDSIVELPADSPLVGMNFGDARQEFPEDIVVQRILRPQEDKALELARLPSLVLRAGDCLYLHGRASAIKDFQNNYGSGDADSELLSSPDQILAEVVVTRGSPLHKTPFSAAQNIFLGDLQPVGISRPGGSGVRIFSERQTTEFVLRAGDILLVEGERKQIDRLAKAHNLMVLKRTEQVPRSAKAPLAILIMTGVVTIAALGWAPILTSALIGFCLMLLGRCLAPEEAWRTLDAKLILLIATSLALGVALTGTGAADFLAHTFVEAVKDLPPAVIVSAILLMTALLTEFVTNNTVAVIATPIALLVATELQLPPEPFVLAVLFGANMSYMTPIGYQTNLLVFTLGGYRFADFFRAGIPLQLILWLTMSLLLSALYL